MDVYEILALIAALIGIVGSVLPAIPGPPLSWVGLLLLNINGSIDSSTLSIWLVITIAVTVLDYLIPAWTTRLTGGHKAASIGALVGLFAGIILTPIGMILGSLLGAIIGELIVTEQGGWAALKAGLGAFLGFILSTGMKIISSGIMAYLIVKAIFF